MQNATDELIEYLLEKTENELPKHIIAKAKECLLDYIGVAYAGAHQTKQRFSSYLNHLSPGSSNVIGSTQRADMLSAAFLNAFNAHVMEMDDGHRYGMIHLGGSIISAVLAAAQKESLEGIHIIKGIVLGYEAAVRLAISMQPSHKQKGYHTAGTCGTIGAAVAVAVALEMNEIQLKRVISAAVTSASGLLEIQEERSELKPYNVGRAAMDGLAAAYMGYTEFGGPEDIIAGARGMVRVMADHFDLYKLTEKTEYYEIERIYVKPYAACRHCHSAIEGALTLRYGTKLEDIDEINVYTYQLAVKGHDHTLIQGAGSAKLSIPYCVAAAIVLGDCSPAAFDEKYITDNQILSLARKVCIYENKQYTAMSPEKRISEVNIYLKNGQCKTKRVEYAKGDPENPMTEQELTQKFMALMRLAGAEEKINSILTLIKNLETINLTCAGL